MRADDGRAALEWAPLFCGLPRADTPDGARLSAFLDGNRPAALAALPWVAAEIAGNEGFDVMLDFVRTRGGQRIYVSAERARCEAALAVGIGTRTHRRIIEGAGPASLIDAPSAWGVFLALRRVAIEGALSRGIEDAAVSTAFGVTARSLRKARQG